MRWNPGLLFLHVDTFKFLIDFYKNQMLVRKSTQESVIELPSRISCCSASKAIQDQFNSRNFRAGVHQTTDVEFLFSCTECCYTQKFSLAESWFYMGALFPFPIKQERSTTSSFMSGDFQCWSFIAAQNFEKAFYFCHSSHTLISWPGIILCSCWCCLKII